MDGFTLQVESYKKYLELHPELDQSTKEGIQITIKANQAFIGTTETERDAMFDTGAFNEICKSYFIKAMKNCELSEDVISSVMDEFKWLLDTVSSTEIKNAIEKKLAN